MSRYIRSREGSIFFFTVVTHERRPILTTPASRRRLREVIKNVKRKRPFEMIVFALLPDHSHTVWNLPRDDNDYSARWRLLKTNFTKKWTTTPNGEGQRLASRKLKHDRGIWQRRFHEHTCRDEADLNRCVDYVHVNPLKHGLVKRVIDWPWSSFHRYVKRGLYLPVWGRPTNGMATSLPTRNSWVTLR